MHEETVGSKIVKWVLIGVSVLFLVVMLLLPLATVISEALRAASPVNSSSSSTTFIAQGGTLASSKRSPRNRNAVS